MHCRRCNKYQTNTSYCNQPGCPLGRHDDPTGYIAPAYTPPSYDSSPSYDSGPSFAGGGGDSGGGGASGEF